MRNRPTVLLRLGLLGTILAVGQPAHAESWSTLYSDSEISVSYDSDSLEQTPEGTMMVSWRTTFAVAQYPDPDSSISETTPFYTRQQYIEIDCASQILWIWGVWYLDYSGQVLGGSEGEGPAVTIRSGTVAELLSRQVCG